MFLRSQTLCPYDPAPGDRPPQKRRARHVSPVISYGRGRDLTVCPAAVAVATPPAPVPPAPTTASDDTHSHSDIEAVATHNHRHKQHPFDPVLHLSLLRFLTNDAPHKCPFPGCTYKFGANIEEVNSNAVPIREHVKFHHFSMRKDGNENGYKCGWPGCASTSRFDAGTITRHTEEKHLGWRYRCPDGKAHGPLGFVRADTLTKHIKEQAALGSHMNSEYLGFVISFRTYSYSLISQRRK